MRVCVYVYVCVTKRVRVYVCDNEIETCSPAVVAAMPTSASSLPTAICPSDSGTHNIDTQEIWMTTEHVCVYVYVYVFV